jgi:hypothetical protein
VETGDLKRAIVAYKARATQYSGPSQPTRHCSRCREADEARGRGLRRATADDAQCRVRQVVKRHPYVAVGRTGEVFPLTLDWQIRIVAIRVDGVCVDKVNDGGLRIVTILGQLVVGDRDVIR